MRSLLLSAAAILTITACAAAPGATDPAAYETALAAPQRYSADHAKDAQRKPAQVFSFCGIRPGTQVLDLFSGGGYTTEYLSWLEGSGGGVTAYNPPSYDKYVHDELIARYAGDRLKNVTRITRDITDMGLPAAHFDAAVTVQNFHDLYLPEKPDGGHDDVPAFLAAVRASLKPGAVLCVVDHRAAAGAGTSVAPKLHRIEQSAVVAAVTAAGFVLEGESDVLTNPADDHTRTVFDPAIRGRTDQMVLRFRLPKR